MFSQIKQHSLTRRNTKLMVEIVIGIIGLLGIMLAQLEPSRSSMDQMLLDNDKTVIGEGVAKVVTKIDWLDILF